MKNNKSTNQNKPKIGGTLDIGAGDRPYSEASIAVDEYLPRKPRGNYPRKGKVHVIVSGTSKGDMGLPLILPKSSRLRLYYVGSASDLPNSWNNQISKIKTRNALGEMPKSVAREINQVLKPGGEVYVLQNAPGHPDEKVQERLNKKHIMEMTDFLKRAGLVNIKVIERSSDGDYSFTANKPGHRITKPMRRLTPKMPRITPKPPRITPKMRRL